MHFLETVGKWLYRRYRPGPNKPAWELIGGQERHRWLSDAQGMIDALEGDGSAVTPVRVTRTTIWPDQRIVGSNDGMGTPLGKSWGDANPAGEACPERGRSMKTRRDRQTDGDGPDSPIKATSASCGDTSPKEAVGASDTPQDALRPVPHESSALAASLLSEEQRQVMWEATKKHWRRAPGDGETK